MRCRRDIEDGVQEKDGIPRRDLVPDLIYWILSMNDGSMQDLDGLLV